MKKHLWALGLLAMLFVFSCSKQPKPPQPGDHVQLSSTLGLTVEPHGLIQVHTKGDGQTYPTNAFGKDCQWLKIKNNRADCYAYFQVDPAFKNNGYFPPQVTLEVEYLDADRGGFYIEYDRAGDAKAKASSYAHSNENIKLEGSKQWKKGVFILERPRFEGRQNSKADFRIRTGRNGLFVRSVTMRLEY